MAEIGEVVVERAGKRYKSVRLVFGSHYLVEIAEDQGRVRLILGATHHGISADASEVGGELECFINELRVAHPENIVD
ncbi:MAG: hypothetical protein M3Q65_13595 [Chloroflexota bacterium]|nr:hypothetical protein [Chloroflexota bacterium]